MPKKVLILRSAPYDLDVNGYNVQEMGMAKAFCRCGYDCDFITFKKKNQIDEVFYRYNECQARIIELPRHRFLRWGINFDILKSDFLNRYDYIISREYYQIMTYLISKRSANVSMYSGPYYNMFMIKPFSYVYDFFVTPKMNNNIRVKFVKSKLAEEFMKAKGYTNLVNVGVGLDIERFDDCCNTEITSDTEKLIDYMKDNRCILYIGALSTRKNYPFLLDVYSKIIKKEPDVKLVIIGKSKQSTIAKLLGKKDESYAKKYEKKLSIEMKKGIYSVSRIDNSQLKYIYPLAKAFLLPSKKEIFGMVLLEAMYLGTPVVSSKNGGSSTLFEDGDAGKIVLEYDSNTWADATLDYFYDLKYTEDIVSEARKKIECEYNWDAIVHKMCTYIEK